MKNGHNDLLEVQCDYWLCWYVCLESPMSLVADTQGLTLLRQAVTPSSWVSFPVGWPLTPSLGPLPATTSAPAYGELGLRAQHLHIGCFRQG